jgi:RNA polymerase sigma-70 factor (ECF subfamily)
MKPDTSFAALMRRLEAGDTEAAALVYGRFARRLIGLAHRELAQRLRRKVDPDDVVQSVFRTFFRRAAERAFDLDGEDALWALLAEITLRKCGRWSRHFAARKRAGDLQAAPIAGVAPDNEPADAREPSPADAAMLLDLLDHLLRGLGEQEQLVCEMRLQGHEAEAIAARAGCSTATVYRKVDLIKARVRRLLPEAD